MTFAGAALEGFPEGREGANCKLLLPEPAEAIDTFAEWLDNGPASAWARADDAGGAHHQVEA